MSCGRLYCGLLQMFQRPSLSAVVTACPYDFHLLLFVKINLPVLLSDHFGHENCGHSMNRSGGVCASEMTHGFVPGVGYSK